MAERRLIQIVPHRGVAAEGVGDYARLIAERMLAVHGVRTIFIACTPLPPDQRLRDDWETVELARRDASDLLAALRMVGEAPILLQLSGYGFDANALTFWVDRALREWLRADSQRRLMTVFHELYAKGPIWTRPFWLGWLQLAGVRRIFRRSAASIATTRKNVALLRSAGTAGTAEPAWMPCFSTIGEPAGDVPRANDRPARLAIFGRGAVLGSIYGSHRDRLAEFVRQNGIGEIVDIGVRPAPPPAEIAGVPVRAMGEMAPSALIAELCQARFGMLHYEANRLAKSSIFGAFCACGAIPVCISDEAGREDGLAPDEQYLRLTATGACPAPERDTLDRLQASARSWYEPHSIAATVDLIHDRLIAAGGDTVYRPRHTPASD